MTMKYEPTLSPRFVSHLRDYLEAKNWLDISLFKEPGFNSQAEEADPPIPLSVMADYFERAKIQTGDSYIGMHSAQNHRYESAGIIILTMLSASSVQEGIDALCRYDKYLDSAIKTTFIKKAKVSEFSIDLINPKNIKVDQLFEFLSCFFIEILNKATRQPVPVTKVWFSHNRDDDKQPLEQFFGAKVIYNQRQNKIFLDSDYLNERFLTSNSLLFEIMTNALKTYFMSKLKENHFVDSICREIIIQTPTQSPTINSVAQSLALTPRTLSRRLSEEGYSFQQVKNIAREERAKYFLSNTAMPLAEIGYQLGFSELSAFSRAFRKWTGVNPQSYRNKDLLYHSL